HAQTARGWVAVHDSRRHLGRTRDLRGKGFVAQADEDTAQALHDSVVTQQEANRAQEQAQTSVLRAAEAQLKIGEAQLTKDERNVNSTDARRLLTSFAGGRRR